MLKLLSTLVRGSVAEAEKAAFDAHATRILAQQLHDAAAALEHSRGELACVMARWQCSQLTYGLVALLGKNGQGEGACCRTTMG